MNIIIPILIALVLALVTIAFVGYPLLREPDPAKSMVDSTDEHESQRKERRHSQHSSHPGRPTD